VGVYSSGEGVVALKVRRRFFSRLEP